jgi:hypothetical protein
MKWLKWKCHVESWTDFDKVMLGLYITPCRACLVFGARFELQRWIFWKRIILLRCAQLGDRQYRCNCTGIYSCYSSLRSQWHLDRTSLAVETTALYRVPREEYARFRKGVPYVKVCRYNPKHLCPKLNGYGDNGQRKVWPCGGSTRSADKSYQSISLSVVSDDGWLHMCYLQGTLRCAISHVTSVLAIHVWCIVLWTLNDNYDIEC